MATPVTHAYGPGPEQVGDLRLPPGGVPPATVVLLHGGLWRERHRRDELEPLATDLTRRGWATWNLEYRRVGPSGGGWPATFHDVAAGVDALADLGGRHGLDLGRVGVLGHSAGGQLALWAAARGGLPAGAPGAAPRVTARVAVALAGVVDLVAMAARERGDRPVAEFLGGGTDQVADRYALASPAERLPLGVAQVLVHGTADASVPAALSRGYAERARAAGDDVALHELDGVDHVAVVDPSSPAWAVTVDALHARLPPRVAG